MHWELQMWSVTTYLTSAAQRTQRLESSAHTNFYIHTRMLVTVCLQSTKWLLMKIKEKKDVEIGMLVYSFCAPESNIKYLSNKQQRAHDMQYND